MKKNELRCWYCQAKGMVNIGVYLKCPECGATWNDVIRPGPPLLAEAKEPTLKDQDTSGSPHSRIERKIARYRGRKVGAKA